MVPVVVQDAENDEVLMLAYMNEEAFEKILHDDNVIDVDEDELH